MGRQCGGADTVQLVQVRYCTPNVLTNLERGVGQSDLRKVIPNGQEGERHGLGNAQATAAWLPSPNHMLFVLIVRGSPRRPIRDPVHGLPPRLQPVTAASMRIHPPLVARRSPTDEGHFAVQVLGYGTLRPKDGWWSHPAGCVQDWSLGGLLWLAAFESEAYRCRLCETCLGDLCRDVCAGLLSSTR